jgi:HSP20 family protein
MSQLFRKLFWIWEEKQITKLDESIKEEQDESTWQIAIDILETESEITLLAPIAGVSLEEIDISFNSAVLSISGKREKPDIFYHDTTLRNSECFWWKFRRNVILPENLDFDTIGASMENNLLIITIRKLQFTSQSIKIDRIDV